MKRLLEYNSYVKLETSLLETITNSPLTFFQFFNFDKCKIFLTSVEHLQLNSTNRNRPGVGNTVSDEYVDITKLRYHRDSEDPKYSGLGKEDVDKLKIDLEADLNYVLKNTSVSNEHDFKENIYAAISPWEFDSPDFILIMIFDNFKGIANVLTKEVCKTNYLVLAKGDLKNEYFINGKKFKFNVFSTTQHILKFKDTSLYKTITNEELLIFNLIKDIDLLNIISSEYNKPFKELDINNIIYDLETIVFNRKGIFEFTLNDDLIKCMYEKISKKEVKNLEEILNDDERGIILCDRIREYIQMNEYRLPKSISETVASFFNYSKNKSVIDIKPNKELVQ